ncbi:MULTISPECIES: PadR family transcriptional regulator [unclassified Rathayibacter]|uniref:PadR family transcriptional regulator n=1 Tax=unclassified Rathayibacter TaxID=2609250 RepID=UPI000FBEC6AE|nr:MULTISPECIES: PadR family transcriptional regulator [unclassified Rathayibacter]ROP44400.1 PadR family transcriptional regulator [Rathayibacter sp. PhB186]ROS46932.1 PadR family transcriptional regulator [Rathayibacter sp. PhB185]
MAGTQMQEPTFLILSALAEGDKHGYALIEDVAALSCGAVRLRPGTLYTALDRLARTGFVTPLADVVVNGRTRRHYSLTDEGAARLADEAARLEANAAAARSMLRRRRGITPAGGLT